MTTNTGTITISYNKKKLRKTLLTTIVFVILGGWILVFNPQVSNTLINSPAVKYGAGGLGVLFFGAVAVHTMVKLRDKKPAQVIDGNGITDHTNAFANGLIAWGDIERIEMHRLMKQPFLIIVVKNPHDYIERRKGAMARASGKNSLRNYGSPLTISATTLSMNMEDLRALLIERLSAFRQQAAKDNGSSGIA